ncbi:MAG: serine/threonine-protein phosphatase [Bdellovibrionales bacterium]|nr:serine/threonine-protein phosphatase [Bdellovibrionales bacterium]
MPDEKSLLKKIQELETQIATKDQDLKIYRDELSLANKKLEALIIQMNDQLQHAHRIQRYLVPTEFPNIQGFEFSTKFKSSSLSGGDYFDIFEHHDKMRFGIFLSSASGYGMSALFLSVLMKMTFEIEDRQSRDPAQVMVEIIQELQGQSQPKDSAAIFYGVFDRRKFELTYSNLGQPLVLFYQDESQRLDLLKGGEAHFPMAGEKPVFENLSIELNPKDKLILCSKGFLDLTNQEGHHWGMDELISVIKRNVSKDVHALRNEIFYQADKFCPEPPRDLTVIVLEVKERIIKLASDLS